MPFVQGKCESCGGILTVDPSLKAANCPFCGVAYVVQDSINYYNTSIKVENMHADVVNITDESSSEARLKAGAAYIKIGKYDLAEKEYLFVTKMAPQNHLGWLGLIEARTNNYTKRIKSEKELKLLDDYSRSVLTLDPNGSGNKLIEKWMLFRNSEEERNAAEKEKLSGELSEYEKELNVLLKESNQLSIQIEKKKTQLPSDNTRNSGCFWFFGIFWTMFLVGLLPVIISNTNSFNPSIFFFFVAMFLPGVISIVVAFLITRKRRKIENESVHLSDEINTLNIEIIDIKTKKRDIQLVVESIQKQLNE